jgi:hypothetical protein
MVGVGAGEDIAGELIVGQQQLGFINSEKIGNPVQVVQ